MTIREAMEARHSVRAYTLQPIEGETLTALEREIEACNQESGLSMRLVQNDPKMITGLWAKYGAFENAINYIALIGPDTDDLYRQCGYWGERLVLFAQTLGLSTCWIAGSYKKKLARPMAGEGQRLAAIVSIGYAKKPGKPHRSKTFAQVTDVASDVPDWFKAGVEAALLAPTAINQQQFRFSLKDGQASLKALFGPYARIDLGIVQYHFELAAAHPVAIE